MLSTSHRHTQKTPRSCWGNPKRDGLPAKLFKVDLRRSMDPGAGIVRGGEPGSIHHSCCADMGDFAEEWALGGERV